MTRALVLLGHADPQSFNAALAEAYTSAFRAAGGEASLVTLSELAFDPVLRHGHRTPQALEPDLRALQAAFEAARHVAWFFPTYWASPPAVVRAVVDRLFLPGWAFRYEGAALPVGLLRGRSARVITTMDSPSWWYALSHHRAVHGAFVSGTLRFVGFAPIRTRTVYGLRSQSPEARERLLREMGDLARLDLAGLVPRGQPRVSGVGPKLLGKSPTEPPTTTPHGA